MADLRVALILLVLLGVVLAGCSQQEEKTTSVEEINQEALEEAIGELMVFALSTHFDDPNTPEIEGLNVNPEFGCRGCHFGKEAAPRLDEWGRSAHGGHLLEVKESDLSAAVTEDVAPGWIHYDFKQPNRQPCQKCHTSTGFRNFANDPENYDPANNTFLLVGLQKELLYCWACHRVEDGSFALRNPGKFEKVAEYSEPADRISAVPDLGKANICMVCHSGRSSGAKIKIAENIKTNFGAFNSHYLAAGGVIFRTLPYEFEGREYSDFNPHKGISDLCVACHMPGASHEFRALKSGEKIVITAYQETCSKCHGDEEELASTIEERKVQYEATLDYIRQLLERKGIYYDIGAYPYFYPTPDKEQHTFPNAFTDWPDRDTLGAAYNLNLFAHEPGAFVHNPVYVKQVLYDTIDFLDDGELNGSALSNAPEDVRSFLEGVR
ncbi:MAG: hypothetical protein ABWW66_01370 [Archaeoglobaceae archaeon]